jgi:hypothetical protein
MLLSQKTTSVLMRRMLENDKSIGQPERKVIAGSKPKQLEEMYSVSIARLGYDTDELQQWALLKQAYEPLISLLLLDFYIEWTVSCISWLLAIHLLTANRAIEANK